MKDQAQEYYNKKKANQEIIKHTDIYTIISFGIAITPFFIWWLYLIPFIGTIFEIISIPFFILSIILGFISISRINNNPNKLTGKGFAISAIILSIIYILIIIITTIIKIYILSYIF